MKLIENLLSLLRLKASDAGLDALLILDRIEYLFRKQETELDMTRKERAANQKAIIDLMEENAVIKKERDALLKHLEIADCYCQFCKGTDPGALCEKANLECDVCDPGCRCKDCRDNDKWEWKGVDE